jgi:hypothetical protein
VPDLRRARHQVSFLATALALLSPSRNDALRVAVRASALREGLARRA